MIRPFTLTFLFALFIISCGEAEKKVDNDHSFKIDDFNWLLGSWQDSLRPNQWEIWTSNSRGMHGMGLNIAVSGDTTVFEEISVVQEGSDVLFIADVKGQDYPVKFKATKLVNGLAVFENPKHDFPKYISYQLMESGNNAVMTSSVRAEERRIDFTMVRRSRPL